MFSMSTYRLPVHPTALLLPFASLIYRKVAEYHTKTTQCNEYLWVYCRAAKKLQLLDDHGMNIFASRL